jgi:hypothetical protein
MAATFKFVDGEQETTCFYGFPGDEHVRTLIKGFPFDLVVAARCVKTEHGWVLHEIPENYLAYFGAVIGIMHDWHSASYWATIDAATRDRYRRYNLRRNRIPVVVQIRLADESKIPAPFELLRLLGYFRAITGKAPHITGQTLFQIIPSSAIFRRDLLVGTNELKRLLYSQFDYVRYEHRKYPQRGRQDDDIDRRSLDEITVEEIVKTIFKRLEKERIDYLKGGPDAYTDFVFSLVSTLCSDLRAAGLSAICPHCFRPFIPKTWNQRYCRLICKNAASHIRAKNAGQRGRRRGK